MGWQYGKGRAGETNRGRGEKNDTSKVGKVGGKRKDNGKEI